MMPILRQHSKGFTLIEVLIAMALLAFISILIYEATVRSFDVNRKLSAESSDLMGMSLTLQTLEDDFAQIYTPKFTPVPNPQASGDQSPKLFWSVSQRPDGMRRARFLGTKEKVSFISNGNIRVQRGEPQSDFIAIVWEVVANKTNTYSLRRFSDPVNVFNYTDSQLSTDAKFYTVADNLSSAQFSYYRKEGDKWEDAWDSEGQSVKEGARYPELIRIKMEGPDPTNPAKQLEWVGIYRTNLKINAATETKGNNALPPTP